MWCCIPKMEKWAVVCLLSLMVTYSYEECIKGEFFSEKVHRCMPCSPCPRDQIVRQLCSNNSDTKCGPFSEFNYFNQLEEANREQSASFANPKVYTQKLDKARPVDHPLVKIEGIPTITKDEGEYWKNLAFALIGVLCALIIVATIVVLCACRKLQGTSTVKRPEEDDGDDTDSGYVVIRAIRQMAVPLDPPSTQSGDHGNGTSTAQQWRHLRLQQAYRPKRRLLNEYTDDVFESEDSAGSRRSVKVPLTAIPENSDSDTRNSESGEA